MANFHPIINIDIDKSYIIRKYSDKDPLFVSEKVREVSEDKTSWSNKIVVRINEIIEEEKYTIPKDFVLLYSNETKALNYSFERPMKEYTNEEIIQKMREQLDNTDKDSDVMAIEEVYMALNQKYETFNDIEMAQIIMVLSKLAKESDKLWVSITMKIKEISGALFYFMNENGHIRLSERSLPNMQKEEIMRQSGNIIPYIDHMNAIIDGKIAIPNSV